MRKDTIYIDNNATTPVDPDVFEAMKPYLTERFGNPSSNHSFGWMAKSAVDLAREQVAKLINSDPEEIIFTSGATESINLFHFGFARNNSSKGKHIVSSATEHSASYDSLNELKKEGFEIDFLPVGRNGIVNTEQLKEMIKDDTILVSVIAGNNEIGSVNDLKTIAEICHQKEVVFHTDATQFVGKLPFDVKELNIDAASFTSHKIYGVKGTGALFIKKKLQSKIHPLTFGGGQEKEIRSGTLNVPGIVAFGKAAEICNESLRSESNRIRNLTDRFYKKVISSLNEVYLNGSQKNRIPGNLNFTIDGVKADKLMLKMRDVTFSKSSACASGKGKPSRILKVIGLNDELANSTIRFGIGRFNTEEEIDYVCNSLIEAVNEIRIQSQSNYKQKEELIDNG